MQRNALKKLQMLQEALQSDEEYQAMKKEYRLRQAQLRKVLEALPEEQRTVILEYIGLCAEMDVRTTEVACFIL